MARALAGFVGALGFPSAFDQVHELHDLQLAPKISPVESLAAELFVDALHFGEGEGGWHHAEGCVRNHGVVEPVADCADGGLEDAGVVEGELAGAGLLEAVPSGRRRVAAGLNQGFGVVRQQREAGGRDDPAFVAAV